MKKINWGIIGCGDVTEVKSGPAFNKVANSSLVAVMRRNADKAKDYAERHQVSKWYSDASLLINDPEVNAIYIATTPLQHEMYALQAIAAGKPVYVEKPFTLNAASARKINEAALMNGVKLSVAHYRRAQPVFLKVKELLDAGIIGEVRFVDLKMLQSPATSLIANTETNWRIDPKISGGGLFHDLAPHQLDLMLYYFGDYIKAKGFAVNQDLRNEADDLVTGQILFQNKILFNGIWCFTVAKDEEKDLCVITGSKGTITFPVFGHQIIVSIGDVQEEFIFQPLPHVQQPMIERVVDYFLGKGENPCPAATAVKSMELMDHFTALNITGD
jgi:predicted dehydrogenase